MYISVFIEIDANRECKYKEEFMQAVKECRTSGGNVIASKEYVALLEQAESVVWEIPEEVMADICVNLENDWDREYLLVIQRNQKLEQWLQKCLENNKVENGFILCYKEYISVGKVAQKNNMEAYCQYNDGDNEVQNGMQQMVTSMQRQMEVAEKKEKELLEQIDGLKEYIASTENYLKELQKHATNLDNQLQEYKAFYEENSGGIERLQEERQKYLELYKENLEELNEIRTNYLTLQEQVGHHKKRKEK